MDTILFDLDGTLLPMEMKAFMKAYFAALTAKCAEYGFEPEKTTKAVWAGTAAMVKNDGTATNEDRFWQVFEEMMENYNPQLKPALELFYENEFNTARAATRPNPGAAPLVRGLREKGFTLVLATNPLFPMRAMRTRLGWIGLTPEDFDLVTCYEECHHTKPNPEYYREILRRIGKQPGQCLMVGNDADEDVAAAAAGLEVYLVTDDLLNESGREIGAYRHGSFAECAAWLQTLAPEA